MSKYDKMLEVNHKQSVEKIQRAKLTIQEMIEEEDKVTVPKLMQKTGLSRGFFYKNPEVRKAVDRALQLQAAKIAENLVDSNMTINKSIFTAAWEYVDEKGKKTLMFKYLSILEAADFENCFSELSQWYSGFCDRSKKHSVELPNNEESQRLAKRLQEVSYITSYKLQEKEVYDSVTETKKKKSTFVCWIKAIKG